MQDPESLPPIDLEYRIALLIQAYYSCIYHELDVEVSLTVWKCQAGGGL